MYLKQWATVSMNINLKWRYQSISGSTHDISIVIYRLVILVGVNPIIVLTISGETDLKPTWLFNCSHIVLFNILPCSCLVYMSEILFTKTKCWSKRRHWNISVTPHIISNHQTQFWQLILWPHMWFTYKRYTLYIYMIKYAIAFMMTTGFMHYWYIFG